MSVENEAIQIGDLVQFCLDPRYPSAKSSYSLKKLQENFKIHVGVVTSEVDKFGYVKIHATPSVESNNVTGKNEIEVHIEFCKVISSP